VGRGQNTKTDGHALRSTREAVEAAKREDVVEVWMNRGLNKITDSKPGTYKSNYRADVMIKTKDGRLHPREVPSNSDRIGDLKERMDEAISRLRKDQQGEGKIIDITKSK
jgi:hypothetical protein